MARLPKSIIKKYGITKKAWQVYRGRKKRSTRRASPKTKRRRRTYLARRRRRSRRRDNAIPLAATMGVVGGALFSGGPTSLFKYIQDGLNGSIGWDDVGKQALLRFVGIGRDGKFYPDYIMQTYTPMVAGALISKFIGGGPLNVNRKIPKAIRKYVKI